jgi:hypothetical protein
MTINQALDKVLSLYKNDDRKYRMTQKLKELQMKHGGRTKVDSFLEVEVIEMMEDDKI